MAEKAEFGIQTIEDHRVGNDKHVGHTHSEKLHVGHHDVAATVLEYNAGTNKKHAGDAASDELVTVDAGFADVLVALPPDEERRILSKVDYRLVPLLAILYVICFIDRSNIGNAKIAGMEEDLKLQGMMYNIALTMFFIPYGLFEVPSNIVLKMMRPSRWIAILMLSWGLVMTLMCLIESHQGLYVARWFLGVAEAGFFPAASYLLTIWYKRYEVQKRMAVFYTAACLSGAFSGLLAFGIEHMNGISGLGGWQWIFLIEGLIPVATSLFIWKLLPDNPETASFLEKEEKEFIINRLALETGSGHGRVTNSDKITLKQIAAPFKEYRIYMAWVMYWGNSIGVYGFTATAPTVIEGLGYKSAIAQLMTVPIYMFAMIMVVVWAWWSEKAQQRSPFIMGGFAVAVFGFIGQLAIPHTRLSGLTYFFLFPVAAGLYMPFVMILTWIANNLAPSSKRAVGMALLISVGNWGGIAGSNIFIKSNAPKYPIGFGVCLAIALAAIAMAAILRFNYKRENAKRRRLIEEEGEEAIRARYSEQELLEMGDKSPFFIYTL